MGKRFYVLGIALTAILATVSCLPHGAYAAQPYYAVGISSTGLYMFGVGTTFNGTPYVPLYQFGSTANPSDVAVHGNYVFVTDKNANKLHVLKISGMDGTPTATQVSEVSLSNESLHVDQPFSVAVSGNREQVYVVGQKWASDGVGHYTFASVTGGPGWTTPTVQIGALQDAPMIGVAGRPGSGAVIGHWDTSTEFGGAPTQISTVNGVAVSGPVDANLMDEDEHAFSPRAIAAGQIGENSFAYVLNEFYDGNVDHGSISVFNTSGPSRVTNAIELPFGMKPTAGGGEAIAAFSFGGHSYIAISGLRDYNPETRVGTEQIWRIQLSDSGIPMMDTIQPFSIPPGDLNPSAHYLGASWDGNVLWVANSHAGSVFALDTDGWQILPGGHFADFGAEIWQIADYHYVPVPEPSCLAAISIFGLGSLGAFRLRRRRV